MIEIKNFIEFTTALGDASRPKQAAAPASLRTSAIPCKAPSLSLV